MSAIGHSVFGDFHNSVFDFVRIRYHTEKETLLFTGSLHGDITEIENSRNDAFHGRRDILDAGEVELAYVAIEKPLLFNIHDTLIGDDPDVEIVIDPGEKTEKPYENKESVFHKDEKFLSTDTEYIREEEEEHHKAPNKEKREKKNEEKTGKDVEPMTMDHTDNLFAFTLRSEMIGMKCVGHR